MNSNELQIAKIESRFRNVNERLVQSAQSVGLREAELVCECADANCGHSIATPLDEYERVRADGALFLLAPEHEEREHEEVIESRPGYRIVEKVKGVGAAARRLNPRRAR